jgi:DNA (cytosine-5)-methyltransferase 1
VFVVASSRDDINLTEILFEFEGLRRDTPQSRKEGKVTPTISSSGTGVSRVGFNCEDEWFIETPVVGALDTECGGRKMTHQTVDNGHLVSTFTPSSIGGYREGIGTLRANGGDVGGGSENLVAARMVAFGEYSVDGTASAMKARDWKDATDLVAQPVAVYENHPSDSRVTELGDVSSTVRARWGTGGGNAPMVAQPIAYNITFCDANGTRSDRPNGGLYVNETDVTSTLTKAGIGTNVAQPIAFPSTLSGTQCASAENIAPSMGSANPTAVATPMAVRRLTPVECERLQGFPDGYTNIPWRKAAESPDGPRYKALGNSWAVPVVAWIGQRIQNQLK